MPASTQYEVIVEFWRMDRKSGDEVHYGVGDPYSGDDIDKYLKGVDSQGPLIREKTGDSKSDSVAPLADSGSKGK